RINVQIAVCLDVEVYEPMPCDLIEHMVKKRHAGGNILPAGTVKVDGDADARLISITGNFCGTHDKARVVKNIGPMGRRNSAIRGSLGLRIIALLDLAWQTEARASARGQSVCEANRNSA